ncbi:hypothetical protein F383_01812 [Gossypium arboreum]|uniref:Uncharacterized protein n=1 Tax=Gossypium arboreum TaxID=29729 RepID=A0A0B0PB41_GOSAR|nr:hypothetical protein F383_01812 [Gossypium arboreum]
MISPYLLSEQLERFDCSLVSDKSELYITLSNC